MTEPDRPDAALDAWLRAGTPRDLPDDGFVARTMAAVDTAARALPARRPTPPAPLAIARAIAAEHRRHAAQARMWHWAGGGVAAGVAAMVVAMACAPEGGLTVVLPPPQDLGAPSLLLAIGALWVAWRELRRA